MASGGVQPLLDADTVRRAAQSLLTYVGKQQQKQGSTRSWQEDGAPSAAPRRPLFEDDDELLYLQVALKTCPEGSRRDKPVRLPIPHSLYASGQHEVCLLIKDPPKGQGRAGAKAAKAAAKQRLRALSAASSPSASDAVAVTKVIPLSKLRRKYESYEAKRQLAASYDLFLADDRILPLLPSALGKAFFRRKKQPIPVRLGPGTDWGAQVRRAVLRATYMLKPSGSCISIRVARAHFSAAQVAANAAAALHAAVPHIPRKWANVQGVFLKTGESVALPLYQALPTQPPQIAAERA